MKKKFRRKVLYCLLVIVGAVARILPYRFVIFLGGLFGKLTFRVLPKEKKKAIDNLTAAIGKERREAEIQRTAKGVFANLGRTLAELLCFSKINAKNIHRFVETEGEEKIRQALLGGKGVIVISAHFGNWELLAAYAGLKGYRPNVVARRIYYEKYDALLNKLRQRKGVNVVYRDESIKKLVKLLRENQLVAILPDQDVDSVDGVFVDFFGRPAYTPTGPVLLAQVSGAPVFPCYIIRENRRHRIVIEDQIQFASTGDKQRDLIINTQKWSRVTESYIRKYPEQWVWIHKRWKTSQKG